MHVNVFVQIRSAHLKLISRQSSHSLLLFIVQLSQNILDFILKEMRQGCAATAYQ